MIVTKEVKIPAWDISKMIVVAKLLGVKVATLRQSFLDGNATITVVTVVK